MTDIFDDIAQILGDSKGLLKKARTLEAATRPDNVLPFPAPAPVVPIRRFLSLDCRDGVHDVQNCDCDCDCHSVAGRVARFDPKVRRATFISLPPDPVLDQRIIDLLNEPRAGARSPMAAMEDGNDDIDPYTPEPSEADPDDLREAWLEARS